MINAYNKGGTEVTRVRSAFPYKESTVRRIIGKIDAHLGGDTGVHTEIT